MIGEEGMREGILKRREEERSGKERERGNTREKRRRGNREGILKRREEETRGEERERAFLQGQDKGGGEGEEMRTGGREGGEIER